MTFKHIPVMLDEVVHYLNCAPGHVVVDCTLGGSGHAGKILEKILPNGILIGIDQDKDAIENAEKVLKAHTQNIHLFHDNFLHLPQILGERNIAAVNGIVLDLGLSLHQIESSGRGFSFNRDEPLDMRMNASTVTTAENIINTMPVKGLQKIFREYGEERWAGRIARKIVHERQHKAIRSTSQLTKIILNAIPAKAQHSRRVHPSTKTFMALRIAVNKELERLEQFMKSVAALLEPRGRLCVISFHSLEDRIIKHGIRNLESPCRCAPDLPQCICGKKMIMKAVIKKVLRPTGDEITANPRARSAKLRVAEKV